MKTYYDLTNQEKSKYEKEFRKTPVGKDMYIRRIIADILATAIVILVFLIDYQMETNFSTGLFFCTLLLVVVYKVYYNVNFTAWLKNKHDIKRW